MISLALSLIATISLATPPSSASPTNSVAPDSKRTGTESAVVPPAFPEQASARGDDLIFADDFETGTHRWSFASSFSQTGVGEMFDLENCNISPGDYIFTAQADNSAGSYAISYPVTVTEVPCADRPELCNEYAFGTPTISP